MGEARWQPPLSGQLFTDQGGLAGILSGSADGLLAGLDKHQRERALELLFRLVRIDREARRHTRRRIPLAEAVDVAGGDQRGRALVDHLAGQRRRDGGTAEGPLRLITVTGKAGKDKTSQGEGRWVNLIHETLIRSKGLDEAGNPQPYWPTLWTYIEKNKERAARLERLQLLAREWKDRQGWARLFGLAGWSSLLRFRGLAASGSIEHRYLRWSRGRAVVEGIVLVAILGLVGESVYWAMVRGLPLEVLTERWTYLLGKDLPLPELVEIPAGSFMMGTRLIIILPEAKEITAQTGSSGHSRPAIRPWPDRGNVSRVGCVCRRRRVRRISPRRSELGPRRPAGDQRLLGGCAGLRRMVEPEDGQELSPAERGRVGIRRPCQYHDRIRPAGAGWQ